MVVVFFIYKNETSSLCQPCQLPKEMVPPMVRRTFVAFNYAYTVFMLTGGTRTFHRITSELARTGYILRDLLVDATGIGSGCCVDGKCYTPAIPFGCFGCCFGR